MSAYPASDIQRNYRSRDLSRGSHGSSPGRDARSEGGYSAYSQKGSKYKDRASTYPKKGTTLGEIQLTPDEETHLEGVLKRFDQFRQTEEIRIRHLRDELVVKQKSRIKSAEESGDGHCYDCGRLFMAVFNAPTECHICKHEFCRLCMEKLPKTKELVCKFCRNESVFRGQLGVWFTEELKQARAAGRVRGVSGPEALRSSLLRLKRESRAASLVQNLDGVTAIAEKLKELSAKTISANHEAGVISPNIFGKAPSDIIETSSSHSSGTEKHSASHHKTNGYDNELPIEKANDSHPERRNNKDRLFNFQEMCIESNQTPIRQRSQRRLSSESDLCTPEDSTHSSSFARCTSPSHALERTNSARLRAHYASRRVHFTTISRPAIRLNNAFEATTGKGFDAEDGTFSDISGSRGRTESWIAETDNTNPPTERQPGPNIRNPIPTINTPKSGTLSNESPGSHVGSLTPSMDDRSSAISHPTVYSSVTDLRPNRPGRHKPRLDSEVGSKSTISLASKNSNDDVTASMASDENGEVDEVGHHLMVPGRLQRVDSSILKSSMRETGPRSRTFSETEFKEFLARPVTFAENSELMIGNWRSVRPVAHSRLPTSFGNGSMLSIYSEHESSYTHGILITGDLRLDIQYDTQSTTLRIAVKQARDLAVVEKKYQACTPYVKAYLLPDKTKASKRKTSHKKHTRNPVFEEELKYRIAYSELSARSLQVAVWHKPTIGTSLFLGEVLIAFADFQFDAGPQWYPLSERRQGPLPVGLQIYRGELLVALKLVPGGTLGTQSELHVWVKSAKGLTTSTSSNSKSATVDPYVKLYLHPDKDKNSKRKTKILKKINNPEWNTNFVYKNIDRTHLPEMGIEVSVWDHDRMSSNDFLGGCRINNGSYNHAWMDAQGTEQNIWISMMERPQTWFEGSIRLRANLD